MDHFPNDMDLLECFKYGPDYISRTRETISNPFWLDVIDSLHMLQTSDCYKGRDVVLNTPLWHSNIFQKQLNRKWHDKGIMTVSDLLNKFLSLEDINSKYNINMNFLAHHILKRTMNDFLEFLKKTSYFQPMNNSINILL